MNSFEQDMITAFETLKKGGVILYPTDTVWGLGCDASNAEAVAKIFKIKQRAESKSLIILVADDKQLLRSVQDVPEVAWDLIDNTDKPLTIIYDGPIGLAPNVIAADGTVGIRIVKDEFCEKLIRKFGRAIVSTSANISGKATPALFHEISNEIISKVDYVVKWRQDDMKISAASTIIQLALNGEFKIIRK